MKGKSYGTEEKTRMLQEADIGASTAGSVSLG